MRIDVALVPVSVRSGPEPQLVAYRQADAWLRTQLRGAAAETAQDLIAKLPPEFGYVMEKTGVAPAPVMFVDEQDRGEHVTLVYSVPLPLPLTDPDFNAEQAAHWIPLLSPATRWATAMKAGSSLIRPEPFADLVVEHWRQRLEETQVLLAFLPRYFTARQARDVYSAVWGYEQDADGFARWSGIGANKKHGVFTANIAAREDLREGELLPELETAIITADHDVARGSADPHLGPTGAAVLAATASQGSVGLSAFALGVAGAAVGTMTAAAIPLAVAAALVAYQRRSRGPKPMWYAKTSPASSDEKLDRLYMPRPAWIFPSG